MLTWQDPARIPAEKDATHVMWLRGETYIENARTTQHFEQLQLQTRVAWFGTLWSTFPGVVPFLFGCLADSGRNSLSLPANYLSERQAFSSQSRVVRFSRLIGNFDTTGRWFRLQVDEGGRRLAQP